MNRAEQRPRPVDLPTPVPLAPDTAPFTDAWKPLAPPPHGNVVAERAVRPGESAVGVRGVGNAEYAVSPGATGYVPARQGDFLAHRRGDRPPPGGARAYALGRARPPGDELPLPRPVPGLDRFTTVGFRCAADLVAAAGARHRTNPARTRS